MSDLRTRFDAWAMAPEPTRPAALFRIGMALWTAAYLLPRLPHLAEIYARPILRHPIRLLLWLDVPAPPLLAVQLVVAAVLVALAFLVAGRALRVAHGVVLVGLGLLFACDTLLIRAYGGIALLSWALLWLLPHDHAEPAGSAPTEPGWGQKLIRLQFASIYPLSALAKLSYGAQWLDGRAVHRIAASPDWGQWLLTADGIPLELARFLGWGTLGLELALGPLLLWPRSRWLGIAGVLALHLGLALTVRVSVLFGLLMAVHLVLFLPHSSASGPR